MQQLVFSSNGLAHNNASGNVYRLGGALGAASGGAGTPGKTGGAALSSPVEKGQSGDVAPWGPANNFPQQVIADLEKSSVIGPVLDWKTRAVYGKGVVYGRVSYDEKGNEIFVRFKDPRIDAFFRRSKIRRYAFEGLQNLNTFYNAWPELVLTLDRSEIYSLAMVDTAYGRYSVPKPGRPVPDWLYISANWPDAAPGDGYTERVPVLDAYADAVEALREDKRGYKYIYPLSLPSPGKALYQLAAWNSIRRSGWLDVAYAIPEFKKALFKNQLSIKYLIEVDVRYWEWKFPDWKEKKEGERKQIIQTELDEFEQKMAGVDGTGKSVLAVTMPDPQNTGGTVHVFKITAIDDKIKSGVLVEDSQEASSHIYTALQVDPTLAGISPGKGVGAGSGSDKRVAFNAFVATHSFYQDLLLELLELVRDYNGWGDDIEFRFLNPQINTLDQKSETATKADHEPAN